MTGNFDVDSYAIKSVLRNLSEVATDLEGRAAGMREFVAKVRGAMETDGLDSFTDPRSAFFANVTYALESAQRPTRSDQAARGALSALVGAYDLDGTV